MKDKIDLSVNGKPMKIVCISDHFMKESFYADCLVKFQGIELIANPYFGAKTRKEMRVMVHNIEANGSHAYELSQEIYDAVKEADLLMVHLCPVTRELMMAAPNLKYILLNRGGTENVDLKAAKEYSSAIASTAINPALCLVFSYSFPGLPRPTIKNILLPIL